MSNEELVAVIQGGATERMGELWEQIERLVKWKANRTMTAMEGCPGRGVEFDGLYQSGYLAMVEAVKNYDPEAGAFSTWLMYYLKTAFAEVTGYRTRKDRNEPLNNYVSLDTPLTDDPNSDTIMDMASDPDSLKGQEAIEETEFRNKLREVVENALSTVPDGCREILRKRYWENLTLEQIGEERGVGKERVRQMENKGLRVLRQPRNACHLRPFYEFDFYCHTSLAAFKQTGMSIQERYLVIEEDRREREAQEQKRRDEEWNRRMEENQKWLAEYRAQQEAQAKVARMTPEEKRALLEKYGYA